MVPENARFTMIGSGMRRAWGLACAAALLAASLGAWVRNEKRLGAPFVRADIEAVPYGIAPGTEPGLTNSTGAATISAGSDPAGAIRAAMETWSSISGSRIRFLDPVTASTSSQSADFENIVTFADTPANRAITGSAVAVTTLFSNVEGELTDTDIIFNPTRTFSTDLTPDTFDIQGTLTHELGHAVGLDHSGVVTATMFATTVRNATRFRTLALDEEAFAREVYPQPGVENLYGSIEGTLTFLGGAPVRSALVAIIEPERNFVIGAIADAAGRYRLAAVPRGDYLLYAEPLDGPAERFHLGSSTAGGTFAFGTTFAGGNDAPRRIRVEPGATPLQADLLVERSAPALNILGFGAAPPGERPRTRLGADVSPGGVYDAELFGPSATEADISEDSIVFLGSGVELIPGTLERNVIEFTDGTSYPRLRFGLHVAADAPPGQVTLRIDSAQAGTSVFTGAVDISANAPLPSISGGAIVHGASFLGVALAPGSIVSLFGENLGPDAGVGGFLDPLTGRLATRVAGVRVLFDGAPASLFFVSAGQINAELPVSATPGAVAAVTVERNGVSSDPEALALRDASPALFTLPGGLEVAAFNQDGTLNSQANPAPRGSVVVLFGTGDGRSAPLVGSGEPAPTEPLSVVAGSASALIDNRVAEMLFAGRAPGFVGLFQMNVRVPANAATGRVGVRVEVRGVASPIGPAVWVE